METWTANVPVYEVKKFIISELSILEKRYKNYRVKRQIDDGKRFLKLIDSFPYCEVSKMGELRKLISQKRNELKEIVANLNNRIPGEQLTLFEDEELRNDAAKGERLKRQKEILKEEIVWLHKALGICANKNYFK